MAPTRILAQSLPPKAMGHPRRISGDKPPRRPAGHSARLGEWHRTHHRPPRAVVSFGCWQTRGNVGVHPIGCAKPADSGSKLILVAQSAEAIASLDVSLSARGRGVFEETPSSPSALPRRSSAIVARDDGELGRGRALVHPRLGRGIWRSPQSGRKFDRIPSRRHKACRDRRGDSDPANTRNPRP